MDGIYSQMIKDIFFNQEPYLFHDFLETRNYNGGYNFCFNSCKKIFDETIKVLAKVKYNGEIVLPDEIIFDTEKSIKSDDLIKSSLSLQKQKIVYNNNIVKLFSSVYNVFNGKIVKREHKFENRDRLWLLPIDGMSAFENGYSNFSVVIVLQQKDNDGVFQNQNVYIFNPIRKDIFVFSSTEGCKYNGKKICFDISYKTNTALNTIIVKDDSFKCHLDVNNIIKTSSGCSFSTSIFSALVDLFTTNKQRIVYQINNNYLPLIKDICKIENLDLNIDSETCEIILKQ